ncbi:hypothetical protein SRHO_G00005200 [Serrasalmus rhombeus]
MLVRDSLHRTLSTRVWPLLLVKPTRGLVDEKLKVIVRNLSPRTVAKDASMGGTYKGVEAMGLMWSMQPVPGSRKGLR